MNKNLRKIIICLFFVTALSSCLKDDSLINWTKQASGKTYLEIVPAGEQTMTLNFIPDEQEYTITLNLATAEAPTSDVTVTLGIDQAALDSYNAENGSSFKLYPSINFPSTTVIIPAGEKSATTTVSFSDANLLSACDEYLAPISVTQISGGILASTNDKTLLLKLPLANPYQGTYHASGSFIHPVNGTRVIDEDKELSTFNCTTVETTVGDLGGYQLLLTINPDNTVTVDGSVNVPGDVEPDGTNTYDPATKTFSLHYRYAGGNGNRKIIETLVAL